MTQAALESHRDGVRAPGIGQDEETTVVRRERDQQLSRAESSLVQGHAEDLLGEWIVIEVRIGCQCVDDDDVRASQPADV